MRARVRIGRRRIAVAAVLMLVALMTLWSILLVSQTSGFGGPQGPWDAAWWTIRDIVRTLWAGATGQPLTRDLFP